LACKAPPKSFLDEDFNHHLEITKLYIRGFDLWVPQCFEERL
jgi:hypothetical protein